MTDEFVTIATFLNPTEAYLAKLRLEEEDIESYVLDENMGNILVGVLQLSTGGIRLQVKQTEAERATAILEQGDTPAPEEPDSSAD
jgi:hypothetical protein